MLLTESRTLIIMSIALFGLLSFGLVVRNAIATIE